MARQIINVGSSPNDNQGDSLRNAGIKINSNFAEVYNIAQNAWDTANTGGGGGSGIDQFARNTANTASSNTVVLQGVNATQNTWITNTNTFAQSAFNSANSISGNVGALQTQMTTTNTNVISVNTFTQSAFNSANAGLTLAAAAYNQANIGGGGVTGNISIASTNSAINFVANSSGDNLGFSTIELVPDTNASSDQRLIIDPTAPSHIHIRAGGPQDSSSAQLFLGGEKNYVRVIDGQGIRLQNEEAIDNYTYYSNTVQYVNGTWYEESGNYFIQFTTDNGQMVNDVSNFAGGSPNEVILYWNNGVEVISNTMISVSGFWQGIGNVYTAQVSATLQANNTTLTAIEFHLFTTQTNYVGIENNDFTVDVYDDVRINARDVFSLRNWSSTDPIEIVTDYDANAWTWAFNSDGTLTFPDSTIQTTAYTGGASLPLANGTSNINIALENGPVTLTANAFILTLDDISGSIDLPGNVTNFGACSAINFVANSSGDGNGYSTIELRPDSNAGTDQYIIIDPTAPGHIHIRAGGIQDDSAADLIIGGENSHLKVAAGANSEISIRANSHQFVYGDFGHGTLRFPNLTYADLPQSPNIIAGQRGFITDANIAAPGNFGAIISGGGSNNTPVWSDGVNWFIG